MSKTMFFPFKKNIILSAVFFFSMNIQAHDPNVCIHAKDTCKNFQNKILLITDIFDGVTNERETINTDMFLSIYGSFSENLYNTCQSQNIKNCPIIPSPKLFYKILRSYGDSVNNKESYTQSFRDEANNFINSKGKINSQNPFDVSWKGSIPEVIRYSEDFNKSFSSDCSSHGSGCNNMLNGSLERLAEFHIKMKRRFHIDPLGNQIDRRNPLVDKFKNARNKISEQFWNFRNRFKKNSEPTID